MLSLGSVIRTDGGGDIGGGVVRLAEPVLQMRRAPHCPQRPFSRQIRLRVKHSSSASSSSSSSSSLICWLLRIDK
jgi:hypothetical protein